uniref:Uncharacterized protein n=1 Tax=Chromera velia CCMP2878 TaxID=1169474 RepID=A0A0G4HPC4_9ALVE|eukprot:Cvel_29818.t1-p1 / transcript=Cvel_29818.t1 / gene=Cvel_29818 / organism=Chromera_velia_CCMP2878 / gene_product=hypothetical protein / transcript_product=hypothetical protein / location=Cvel_scaffold4153:1321-1668(+) / protein_length=116 / sequence_SO=supercontig / SO=protein_coding / is_pseudo=false
MAHSGSKDADDLPPGAPSRLRPQRQAAVEGAQRRQQQEERGNLEALLLVREDGGRGGRVKGTKNLTESVKRRREEQPTGEGKGRQAGKGKGKSKSAVRAHSAPGRMSNIRMLFLRF